LELVALFAAGLLTGFAKFSIGGMGLVILPILMIAVPGPEALGVLMPMYLATDLLAISCYRKAVAWSVLWRFLPAGLVGLVLGGLLLSQIAPGQFSLMLGLLIILLLLLGWWFDKRQHSPFKHPYASPITGLVCGFVSLVANAAGPIASVMLMEQKLDKHSYVSTRAWLFATLNFSKLPVLISIGLLTPQSAITSLYCLPGLLIGAVIGHGLLKRINLQQFKAVIRAVIALAAVKLLIWG